jgi:hypothetical protein
MFELTREQKLIIALVERIKDHELETCTFCPSVNCATCEVNSNDRLLRFANIYLQSIKTCNNCRHGEVEHWSKNKVCLECDCAGEEKKYNNHEWLV